MSKSQKPFNGTCPRCQDVRAYQGFSSWECPNYSCKNYTETQKDLVDQYQKECLEYNLENSYKEYVASTSKETTDNKTPTIPYGVNYNPYNPTDPYDSNTYDSGGFYTSDSLNDDGDDDSYHNSSQQDQDIKDLFGLFLCGNYSGK